MDTFSKCPRCRSLNPSSKIKCEYCGAEIISKQDFTKAMDELFTKAMDEITAHIGIDMSTKGDFTASDITPNAFVGFLGKTEDGKAELAKKEIVKVFDINSPNCGRKIEED